MSAVPQYTGSVQPQAIEVAAAAPGAEDGPGVMPPNPYQELGVDVVPPPVSKTGLWSAMQQYPL